MAVADEVEVVFDGEGMAKGAEAVVCHSKSAVNNGETEGSGLCKGTTVPTQDAALPIFYTSTAHL